MNSLESLFLGGEADHEWPVLLQDQHRDGGGRPADCHGSDQVSLVGSEITDHLTVETVETVKTCLGVKTNRSCRKK